ncbi:MAG: DUF4402 domain-containing protein [Gemmatimonadota bacterium]
MRNSIITLAAAALIALPVAVSGQSTTAQIQALAEVLSPIDVQAGVNLDFGQVLPGVPSQVLPVSGGTFTVSGAADEDVIVDFDLPLVLVDGALSMPVSFDAGYGAGAPTTALDPSADVTVDLGATGGWDVFLGGTVTPAPDQGAGDYAGTVTLTVTYVGS